MLSCLSEKQSTIGFKTSDCKTTTKKIGEKSSVILTLWRRCIWRYFMAKGHFQACALRHFFTSGRRSDLLSPYWLSLFGQDGWILLKLFFVFSWTRRTRDQ